MTGSDRSNRRLALALLVVLGCALGSATARSWDLAVTVGKDIEFVTLMGNTSRRTSIPNASDLVAMAYDDGDTVFLSDASNGKHSIFSVDLSATNATVKPVLKSDNRWRVISMVFDAGTRSLYWTTEHAVMKMNVPLRGAPGKPIVLHDLQTESPRGIALDACNRHIYWTNSNRSSPSIMRSNLDGSERVIVVSGDLYEPTAVAVDHADGHLYWIDDEEGTLFKLERSELDGSSRAVLHRGHHEQPVHMAVDARSIYWADFVYQAVWEMGKEAAAPPRTLRVYEDAGRQLYPTSVLARANLGAAVDCAVMEDERRTRLAPLAPAALANSTTEVEQSGCQNGGRLDGTTCWCKPGYRGSSCEISPCQNYCLRGDCLVSDEGTPRCECGASFVGSRCERDLCGGYCLNNGRCLVDDGKPTCECKYSSGTRCEVTLDMTEICALYCMNRQPQMTSVDTSSCRCAELNQTVEEVLGYDAFNCTILVPILAGFSGMLSIIVIFLSIYVSRLRRRPRIKKRIVLNKSGITPLTSRPSQLPIDQCEITIENCCNMNICETPCFEPKLRKSSAKSNGMKKEEKSGLLDHMENCGNAF